MSNHPLSPLPQKPKPYLAGRTPRRATASRVVVSYGTPPKTNPKSTAILAGWLLLALGFLLAWIPGLGLSMILLAAPFCLAAGLLGVIAAARSQPFGGVLLILASCGAFVVYQLVPWLSALIGIAAIPKH